MVEMVTPESLSLGPKVALAKWVFHSLRMWSDPARLDVLNGVTSPM